MNKNLEQDLVLTQMIEEAKQFKNEKVFRCCNCEKIFNWDDANFNPEENTYTCPHCRNNCEIEQLENINLCDYITEIYLTYKTNEKLGENENDI